MLSHLCFSCRAREDVVVVSLPDISTRNTWSSHLCTLIRTELTPHIANNFGIEISNNSTRSYYPRLLATYFYPLVVPSGWTMSGCGRWSTHWSRLMCLHIRCGKCGFSFLPAVCCASIGPCCGHISSTINMTTTSLTFLGSPSSPIMSTRSLSYNCGSYPLPQELTGLVMENLARDRPSLSASSLVCHSWSKESSRVLFRVLIAGGPPGMGDGLLELVKNSERVRTNIRSLGLSSGNGPSDKPEDYELFSFDKLLQILGYLPRIKSLSFWSLRLKWDTEEPTGLSEFKSTRREFTQLSLWNVPNDPATMSCYTQLISSIRKITCLNVTSGVAMHERPLPTAAATHQAQPSISTSVVPVPTSPLRIENLTVNDGCFSDRYLEWFDCSHNLSINPHKITSFRTTLWPRILRQLYEYHNDRSTSSIPCAVKLIESFTHICFLSLDIGFLASTSELTDSAGGTYLCPICIF